MYPDALKMDFCFSGHNYSSFDESSSMQSFSSSSLSSLHTVCLLCEPHLLLFSTGLAVSWPSEYGSPRMVNRSFRLLLPSNTGDKLRSLKWNSPALSLLYPLLWTTLPVWISLADTVRHLCSGLRLSPLPSTGEWLLSEPLQL